MAKFQFSASQHENVSASQRNFLIQRKNYVNARTSFSAAAEVKVHLEIVGSSRYSLWEALQKYSIFFFSKYDSLKVSEKTDL